MSYDSSIPHYNIMYPDSNGEYHNPEWYNNGSNLNQSEGVLSYIGSSLWSGICWAGDRISDGINWLSKPGNQEKVKRVVGGAMSMAKTAHNYGEKKRAFQAYRESHPSVENTMSAFGKFLKENESKS